MKFNSILAFMIVLAVATPGGAQTRISGTVQCGMPNPQHAIEIGDRPNHSFMLSKATCTWTKPIELAGTPAKDNIATAFDDAIGSRSQTRGFALGTMANGDKYHVRYQGSATLKDGAVQNVEGKWNFTGGTGKLKGIKGQGTYKGTGAADGVTYTVEGEYTLTQ